MTRLVAYMRDGRAGRDSLTLRAAARVIVLLDTVEEVTARATQGRSD